MPGYFTACFSKVRKPLLGAQEAFISISWVELCHVPVPKPITHEGFRTTIFGSLL